MSINAGWEWPHTTLRRIIDGDTIEVHLIKTVLIDVGFGMKHTQTFEIDRQRLRLRGIDAPTRTKDKGNEVVLRLGQLLNDELDPRDLLVVTYKPYKYGGPLDAAEYMGDVLMEDGRFVTQILLAEGLVMPYDGRGPRPAG